MSTPKEDAELIESLIEDRADANLHREPYGSALQAATFKGKASTAEMLIQNGARVNNHEDGEHGSALKFARDRLHDPFSCGL